MKSYYHASLHELLPQNANQKLKIYSYPTALPSYLLESIVILESQPELDQSSWPILPDLSTHLIIKFFKNGNKSIKWVGPRSRAIYIDRSGRDLTILIRFTPGASKPLHDLPQEEICDQAQPLICLDPSIKPYLERITTYYDTDQLSKIIEEVLTYIKVLYQGKSAGKYKFLPQPTHLSCKVNEWAKSLGLSERGLHKASYRYFGMSPKKVLQIQRINKIIRHLQAPLQDSWVGLAILAGYYDQSHFIDEFGSFFGTSPEQWYHDYFKD